MEAHCPLDNLQPYIDDALDLMEFANGDPSTKWGKVRADMGHPRPFNLKFLGVGNEQWDYKDNPVFTERLKKFTAAIRAKYPNIKLIGTTGPDSEGAKFDMLQPKMKEIGVDLYDEHFYRPESWFLDGVNRHRYDNYDRKGPKVFAGEYACHGKGKKWNHYETSLLEAAFMTGIERNADVVHMATYAPLFAHVEGWQWRPDAIWYDNSRSFRSVSYYVQQMYSLNKGHNVLSLLMNKKVVAGDPDQDGLFASAVVDNKTNEFASWDSMKLDPELDALPMFDMSKYGFVLSDGDDVADAFADNGDDAEVYRDVDKVAFKIPVEFLERVRKWLREGGRKKTIRFILEESGCIEEAEPLPEGVGDDDEEE
jgi:alpha-L-arabinofuranosidase